MRALDELGEVDWAELEHAYDDATDVPDLLRALGDGDLEVLGDLSVRCATRAGGSRRARRRSRSSRGSSPATTSTRCPC